VGRRLTSLEGLVSMFWQGRKVFLTGHTGFKGSWLALWLKQLGADVMGYALPAGAQPNLFDAAQVGSSIQSQIGNILDLASLRQAIAEFAPEVVFHLAAQSLVRLSYQDPVGTYATNVLGTANLLEAVRSCDSVRAVVIITTDKCYENKEWIWAYRENDVLGGYDPYSNSKACAEFVVSSYRNSFFHPADFTRHKVAIASARAGNVIGGGDWSTDRLIPDIMRAFSAGELLRIRHPAAVRPWQHVLEPLRGYLMLAQGLYENGIRFSGAWNFGPHSGDAQSVGWIVEHMAKAWGPTARWELDRGEHPHEAQTLKLDWTKASLELDWQPKLHLTEALAMTLDWYQGVVEGKNARQKCYEQIAKYGSREENLSLSSSIE
jgi:CDP-glucose 4,6-dehydratase